jgi:hypothetical protein
LLIEKNTFQDLLNGAHYLFENVTNLVMRGNIYDRTLGLSDNQRVLLGGDWRGSGQPT